MREIVPGESHVGTTELPQDTLRSLLELDAAIGARTQIVWGEHCSECAYPTCYASCSFYSPRPDLHCRRFDRGIEAVTVRGLRSSGSKGQAPLMRVRFLKWGKLVGQGTALRPRELTDRHEKARDAFGKLADLGVLPYGLRYGAGRAWTRFETRSRAGEDCTHADAFVVECVSVGERDVPFTVTVEPKERLRRGLFQERIVLGGGYTRHVIAVDRIAPHVDLSRPFLVHIEPLVESPPEVFHFGFVDFVRWSGNPVSNVPAGGATSSGVKVASVKGTPSAKAKCIVWDLDETLWDGILAEVGIAGVKLRPHVVEVLRSLDARGILHSIASKNDEAEALAALRHFGIDELFLYPQIGWGPKSESVARIAKLLDLHVDTFAFVDDQLFERTEVEESLPGVTTFPHTGLEALAQHPLFDTPITSEGSRRRIMYREEMTRNVVLEAMGSSDYDTFLRSCRIRLKLSLLSDENVTRIYDLSQRTNQLNVTGTRYERRQVEEMARSPGKKLPIVMHCQDRFGDYGIVGFVLLDPDDGLVVDYLMSCRVQRKCVENALFAHIQNLVGARGAKTLRCRYKRTERNRGALDLLRELGFRLHETPHEALHETGAGSGILERELGPIRGSDIVALAAEGVK
jgi:FkbH-like protein